MSVELHPAEIAQQPSPANDEIFRAERSAAAPSLAPSAPRDAIDSTEDDFDPLDDYRAISTPAIASLALGVLSALAILDWWLLAVPVAAVALGIAGLKQVRRESDQYTGRGLAIAGIALAALLGTGGASWLGYVYATEVPEGYGRIDYGLLQPHKNDPPDRIPPEALALDGQQVFIKGYVYPGSQTQGIRQFLLVRDQGDCCFGGDPKITDRIQVQLADTRGFTHTSRLHKLAGTFRIDRREKAYGEAPGAVFYHLEGAQLR